MVLFDSYQQVAAKAKTPHTGDDHGDAVAHRPSATSQRIHRRDECEAAGEDYGGFGFHSKHGFDFLIHGMNGCDFKLPTPVHSAK